MCITSVLTPHGQNTCSILLWCHSFQAQIGKILEFIPNSSLHLTCAWYCSCPLSIGHCLLPLYPTLLPNKVMLSPKLLVFALSLLSPVICLLPVIHSLFLKWMLLLHMLIIIKTVTIATWQCECHNLLSYNLFLMTD